MIIDAYERAASVGGEEAIRQLYMVGHSQHTDPFGHVILDCGADFCFIHAQMYKKDVSAVKEIKEDILSLIDEVLIKEFDYAMISSYTPNKRFLDFVVKGTGWKVQEFDVPGHPEITLCMVNLKDKDATCQPIS